jgi:transcriptional regulator GlxA family with amidase domain
VQVTRVYDLAAPAQGAPACRVRRTPRPFHLSIGTIAYGCGFGDITAFHRTLRRHDGAGPLEVRS